MIDSMLGLVLLMLLAGWMGTLVSAQFSLQPSRRGLAPSEKVAVMRAIVSARSSAQEDSPLGELWDWSQWKKKFSEWQKIQCSDDNVQTGFLSEWQASSIESTLPTLRSVQALMLSPELMQREGDNQTGDEAFEEIEKSDLAPYSTQESRQNLFLQARVIDRSEPGAFRYAKDDSEANWNMLFQGRANLLGTPLDYNLDICDQD